MRDETEWMGDASGNFRDASCFLDTIGAVGNIAEPLGEAVLREEEGDPFER